MQICKKINITNIRKKTEQTIILFDKVFSKRLQDNVFDKKEHQTFRNQFFEYVTDKKTSLFVLKK